MSRTMETVLAARLASALVFPSLFALLFLWIAARNLAEHEWGIAAIAALIDAAMFLAIRATYRRHFRLRDQLLGSREA